MAEVAGWIVERKLKQAEAAEILGVTCPRVSDVINRRASKFMIDALVDMLARIGSACSFLFSSSAPAIRELASADFNV